MQKLYIMFCYIDDVGGGQIYVNSKVPWLEAAGWDVIVFSPLTERSDSIVPWTNLAKFAANKVEGLNKSPEFWSKKKMKAVLEQLQSKCSGEYSEIIIESHTDYFAEWGELLAEKLNAKNICYLLDEQLELYGAKEFLYFKYRRNEVAGITDSSVERLFAGYAPLIKENNHKLSASHSSQAEEYYWDAIEKIQRCDWNIGYVGRSKQYVDNITKNIAIFADRYPDKTINVIILGEILDLRILEDKKNVICTKLGFKFPIPKSFFRKLDVAIAGAGSATLCCREHVPTIVADAGTTNAAGILGYTVSSSIFNPESDRTYCEWLEDILVDKKLEKMKQIYEMPKIDVNKVYQEHMEFIYKSEQSHEYFDFIAHPQKNYTFEDKIKYFLKGTFPGLYKAYKLKRG